MRSNGLWAIVLAPGDEGQPSRVSGAAKCADGLLRNAIALARQVVPRDQVVVVATEGAVTLGTAEGLDLPPENILLQPRERGSAAACLLGLMSILQRDHEARVVVLPHGQAVREETALAASIEQAFSELARERHSILALGMTRDARIVVSRGLSLAMRYDVLVPEVFASFQSAFEGPTSLRLRTLERLYEQLGTGDFSTQIVHSMVAGLRVLELQPRGWEERRASRGRERAAAFA